MERLPLKFRMLAVMLAAVLLLTVLASQALTSTGPERRTITVFAAASLTDAFTEIAAAFEDAHPDAAVTLHFAGSSTLAAQLIEGAPADVFASANERQMEAVIQAGRISSPAVAFAHNRLVLAVPVNNPAHIESLRDLAAPGVLLVLAAPGVPVREYTEQLLDRLAVRPGYGSAYRAAVMANLVSEEPNVRQVVARLALGEADAGIVYRSDVTADVADQIVALPIPDSLNPTATYPIAVTADSRQPALAQAFVDFVLGAEGQAVLSQWAFISAEADGGR